VRSDEAKYEIAWTFENDVPILYNGFIVEDPNTWWNNNMRHKSRQAPSLSIIDPQAQLPINIQRYDIAAPLGVAEKIGRDITYSFLAFHLICGPETPLECALKPRIYPLRVNAILENLLHEWHCDFHNAKLESYCTSRHGFTFTDPYLVSKIVESTPIIIGYSSDSPPIEKGLDSLFDQLFRQHDYHIFVNRSRENSMEEYNFIQRLNKGSPAIVSMQKGDRDLESQIRQSKWTSHEVDDYLIFYNINLDDNAQAELSNITHQLARSIQQKESYDLKKPFAFTTSVKALPPQSQTSVLGEIWDECIGQKLIPFDPKERKDLIQSARQHSQLGLHIEKWQEMKRNNSKWATGEWIQQRNMPYYRDLVPHSSPAYKVPKWASFFTNA